MSSKIKSINIYIVHFPVKILLSIGEVRWTNHLITEIRTYDNVIGIGEGTPYAIMGRSQTNIYNAYMICREVAKKIKGKKFFEAKEMLPQLQKNFMKKPFFDYGPFLAIESSLMDVISKIEEIPLAKVLGEFYRNRIPVCGTVFLESPERMAKDALRWISKGVKHIKVKVTGRKEVDATILKYIRDTVGYKPLIRIDANQAYGSATKAINSIRVLEKYDVAIVEQPVKWNDLEGLRTIRSRVEPKIMVDETLTVPEDVELIVDMKAADIINFHPSKLGCLSVTRETIEKTLELGLEYIIGASVMTSVGVAEHLHLAASMRTLYYPNEEVGLKEMFDKDLVINSLKITNGYIHIPEGYGLGLMIDKESLKRFTLTMPFAKFLYTCVVHRIYPRLPFFSREVIKKLLSILKYT